MLINNFYLNLLEDLLLNYQLKNILQKKKRRLKQKLKKTVIEKIIFRLGMKILKKK